MRGGGAARAARPATAAPATVEFLYEPDRTRSFSFMEVNARLQVEHPVTEADDRARPASSSSSTSPRAGGSRASRRPRSATRSRRGSTPRIPRSASRPAPGRIALLRLPGRARASGSTPASPRATSIPPEFDSMIAKLIAWGDDRDEALARLRRALRRDHGRASRAARPTRASCSSCSTVPELRAGDDRHRLARPPAASRRHDPGAPRRRRAGRRPRSHFADERDRGRPRRLLRPRPPRPARRPAPRPRARSSCATRASATGSTVGEIGPSRYRVDPRRRSRSSWTPSASNPHERRLSARRRTASGSSPRARAPTC